MESWYRSGLDIAIIGMTGRFPGANTIEQFLDNLQLGQQSISFFSDEELAEHGIAQELLHNPNYVKAKGLIADAEYFDASFFDYTPTEALVMDPQMRIVHECAWEALENAGYSPASYDGLIGLYVGGTPNPLWEALTFLADDESVLNPFTKSLLNDKDLMATRVAYKLNLRGPSMSFFTSCSTSLVAIHVAVQALLSGECDIAIAGGVCATYPHKSGYLYQEGMHLSPDGCCRSFDAQANGLAISDAIGLVVLRRVDDAIQAGDAIDALIVGSAVNNDGNAKVGFTAPSVAGQESVIRFAQQLAEIGPEDVGYIETHGSATPLGDTIEIEALKRVFPVADAPYCAIGSVKSNIGHTNSASGVVSLIKSVLSLKYGLLFPSINYATPHPELGIERSPFYVNTELRSWPEHTQARFAGVSSFGVGGTNAHIILREPSSVAKSAATREHEVIVLSAKTATALEQQVGLLKSYLERQPELKLQDIAYTLQAGRSTFAHRKAFVATSVQDMLKKLAGQGERGVWQGVVEAPPQVIFMFAGQGKQYLNMGLGLYAQEPVFRDSIDQCLGYAQSFSGIDYRRYLYPPQSQIMPELVTNTAIAQPVLFCFEYALARLLMHYGILPSGMVGYSFGEITAACLAEVLSLKDAIKLVVRRGQLMRSAPVGTMLSIPLPEAELRPLLNGSLSLAVDNGDSCIISGTASDIGGLQERMKARRILCVPLAGEHAAHSALLQAATEQLHAEIATMSFRPPAIPFVSTVSGTWITEQEATSSHYWAQQMIQPIKFHGAVSTLLAEKKYSFIEIGPGKDLSNMVQRFAQQQGRTAPVVHLIRPESIALSDSVFLANRLALLWTLGAEITWEMVYDPADSSRVHLPTYPFEKQLYRLGKSIADIKRPDTTLAKSPNISDWFYVPTWRRAPIDKVVTGATAASGAWMVLTEQHGVGSAVVQHLLQRDVPHIILERSSAYEVVGPAHFRIDPSQPEHYDALIADLRRRSLVPQNILHLWPLVQPQPNEADAFTAAQERGLYSLILLLQAIQRSDDSSAIKVVLVTQQMQEVTGEEDLRPEYGPLLGAIKVINQEFSRVRCSTVDIQSPGAGSAAEQQLAASLIDEFEAGYKHAEIAYRGKYRWVKEYDPLSVGPVPHERLRIRTNGVYIITGGLGRIGFKLALHLAQRYQARVAIITRSVPSEQPTQPDKDSERGAKIRQLRQQGNILLLRADVADKDQMQQAIATISRELGDMDGVIHAAGITGKETSRSIGAMSRADFEEQFRSKVYGTYVLEEVLRGKELDFCLLLSSLSPILGGLGYGGYAAANSFLDAFVYQHNRCSAQQWICVNWETWVDESRIEQTTSALGAQNARLAMSTDEGLETFERLVSHSGTNQLVVSSAMLTPRIKQWSMLENLSSARPHTPAPRAQTRPSLINAYIAPRTAIEQKLCGLWQAVLGISEVGVQDHFFELGGDSLKLLNTIGAIYREFNIDIPVAEFFNHPTIEYVAQKLDQSTKQTYQAIQPAARKPSYELSSAQKRLYYLHSLDQSGTTYNETTVFLLEGTLDQQRVSHVLKQLIDRHEALRTSFHRQHDRPVQVVHDSVDFEIDCVTASEDTIDDTITSLVTPFLLDRAPLLRVGLIRIAPHKHVLVFHMHHIITDGVSESILVREFMQLYNNQALPPLPVQYKDYAEWQQHTQTTGYLQSQERYWLDKLQQLGPPINLPTDFSRPASLGFEGKSIDFRIDPASTTALKAIAQRESATLYMLFLTLYALFLSKISGDEALLIGTASAGRNHPDLQQTIGMFVNTLVVRARCPGNDSFTHCLRELKAELLGVFQNQDYQFDDLVEKLSIKRDLSRNPLFDVMFVWQNMDVASVEVEGLKFIPFEYHQRSSKFDLTLMGYELGDEIYLKFEYSTKLFKAVTIQRFVQYFQRLVHSIVENTDYLMRDIQLSSPEEQQMLLIDWNATAVSIPEAASVDLLFEEQARAHPDAIAIVDKQQISYRELNSQANQLARCLVAMGVTRGCNVGIVLNPSIDLLIGILGILKAGTAYVPIDPSYPEARKDFMLQDSGVAVVVSATSLHWPGLDRYQTLYVDTPRYKAFPVDNLDRARNKRDLCYVMYTSGSTGVPRGVMIEHQSVIRLVVQPNYVTFGADDRILQTSSPVSDASTFEYWGALLNGLTLYMTDKEDMLDARQLERLVKAHRITMMWLTAPLFHQLCQQNSHIFETLRYLLVGGDVVSARYVKLAEEAHPGLTIINGYGATENTTFSTCFLNDHIDRESIPIGRPISGTQVYILDAYAQPQPIGLVGELCVAGAGLARGYLNAPALTAEKFVCHPTEPSAVMYKTGDRARWLPDGTLEFQGRVDSQVKIHGFRIELQEIQRQLQRHPDVKNVIVVVHEAVHGDKQVCAYYTADQELDPAELKRFVTAALPQYMVPAYIVRLDDILLTVNGKLDLRQLPQPEQPAKRLRREPRSVAEQQLLDVWSQVLGVAKDRIGIDDNLFDMGGNSLTLVELIGRIQQIFATEVSIPMLVQYPTIRSLAAYLATLHTRPLVPVPDEPAESQPRSRLIRRRTQLEE